MNNTLHLCVIKLTKTVANIIIKKHKIMETKELINKKAKNQYGETVIIFEVNENMFRTDKGIITKLFIGGESLQTLLNK
jgi:hypothetical protein